MENLLNIFIKSIFIDNMVFAFFLGMCSYLAVSKNVKTAVGLGIAVTFVLVITVPVNFMIETYVLKKGALAWLGGGFADVDLSFLSFMIFIAVIAAMTQLVEMVVEKFSPFFPLLLLTVQSLEDHFLCRRGSMRMLWRQHPSDSVRVSVGSLLSSALLQYGKK